MKTILIQLFDSFDSDYIGGTYQVSRADGSEFEKSEFLLDFGAVREHFTKEEPDAWTEDDILQGLKEKWNIEYLEVLQVSY
jgi:hypothetical protein